MKNRNGFVSNSSSSSFIIQKGVIDLLKECEDYFFFENKDGEEDTIRGPAVSQKIVDQLIAANNKKYNKNISYAISGWIYNRWYDIFGSTYLWGDKKAKWLDPYYIGIAKVMTDEKFPLDLTDEQYAHIIKYTYNHEMRKHFPKEVEDAHNLMESVCNTIADKLEKKGYIIVEFADDAGEEFGAEMEHRIMPRVLDNYGGFEINHH